MERLGRIGTLLLLAVLTAGCSGKNENPSPAEEPVRLVYYTIGESDEDLKQVEDALNALLLERYHLTVNYNKIGWNDYKARITSFLNTNERFDIAFAWTENYLSNALAGSWLDLTPYLDNVCAGAYEAVDSRFWKGAAVGGRIYGIPTNKELAVPVYFLYDRGLVEKYGIDVGAYRSIESLEPLLEMISEKEPEYIPLFLSDNDASFVAIGGYESILPSDIPLVVRSGDASAEVVDLYGTAYCGRLLEALHRYYMAGYINEDAAMRTSFSRFKDEKVFLRISSGGPDSDVSFSSTFGYPILAEQASDMVVTSESALGGVMVASARTEHPEECAVFLNAVNTDPEVRNLLNFGIEGIHYALNEDGQVEYLAEGYRGIAYTQGNWFLLKTVAGEDPDKWRLYREFNDSTVESCLLGFVPDLSAYAAECARVGRVNEKYASALMTGTVDPEEFLPMLREELEQAGIGTLRRELQRQIGQWMASR